MTPTGPRWVMSRTTAKSSPTAQGLPRVEGADGAVKATMDPVHYEVATVAAARELRSSYCSLAHGSELARQVGVETAIKIASDESTDPPHAAIGELARKVATSPAGITEADLKPLRDLGSQMSTSSTSCLRRQRATSSARCWRRRGGARFRVRKPG
jgi:alkylhydroperoxidase family enzyme